VGVEALIRWMSPERASCPRSSSSPCSRRRGSSSKSASGAPAGRADHAYWTENAPHAPRVAVNVSPIQLRRPNFVEIVKEAIGQGVTSHGLDLEITESILMEEVDANIEKLRACASWA